MCANLDSQARTVKVGFTQDKKKKKKRVQKQYKDFPWGTSRHYVTLYIKVDKISLITTARGKFTFGIKVLHETLFPFPE